MDQDEEYHPNKNTGSGGYAWEAEYKKSWEILQQDQSLEQFVKKIQHTQKRSTISDKPIKRGIIRQTVIIIDASKAMNDLDLKPSRLECTLDLVKEYILEYFDQNPLSMLLILGIRDGLAERWSTWSSNPSELITQLDKVSKETIGEPSIQNALDLAQQTLMHTPNHVSREVILLFGSLSSCDPGNLEETVAGLVDEFIRVSIIGLCAQLRICDWIAQVTNGTYHVILNEAHYKELLHAHVPPPPLKLEKKNQMIQMGFPTGKEFHRPTLCACHQKIIFKGFQCPKCASTVCEIPRDCPICSLTLVSSPSLARSYHHLFPVPVYQEKNEKGTCFACRESIDILFQCPRCRQDFCIDCDLYIHDSLHNCPGCT